jgi:CRP-like cAMP-binding protein
VSSVLSKNAHAYPELLLSSWFCSLTESQRQCLLSASRPVNLVAREYLFHRGDTFNGLFVLLTGSLWISGLDSAGKEIGLTVIKPGEWFGEIALFDGQQRTHDVLASEPCRLLQIPANKLNSLIAADSEWWPRFGRLLTAKVRLLFQNIEDRSQPSAAVRVARKLYEFVLRAPESNTRIDIEMGQEQFGQLVSLSRQKTNQQLKYLESHQVIALEYGKISIISMSKLKKFAQIS